MKDAAHIREDRATMASILNESVETDVEREVESLVDKHLGGNSDGNRAMVNKAREYIERGKRIGFNIGTGVAITTSVLLGAATLVALAAGDDQMAKVLVGIATASTATSIPSRYIGKKIGKHQASKMMQGESIHEAALAESIRELRESFEA